MYPKLSQLMSPKVRQVLNLRRSEEKSHSVPVVVFAIAGVAFWAVILVAAHWFFSRCVEVELVGQVLVRKVIDMTFLTFLSILLFSNVITAFTTFVLAEDLPLLGSAPIPSDRLFHARLLETLADSSWMLLVFGSPIFVAAGIVFSSDLAYYGLLVLVAPAFVMIPASIGAVFTLALATTFPVRRTRELVGLLAVLSFAGLYVFLRTLQPEQLLDTERFDDLVSFVGAFRTPGSSYLPSAWATEALFPALRNEPADGLQYLGVLWSTAAALVVGATWASRPLLFRAMSRGLEGRSAEGFASRAGRVAVSPLTWLTRRTGASSVVRELVLKDARLFFRDATQWSQLMLLLALVVVYLVNFQTFRVLDESGLVTPIGLYFLNLGLGGFVVAALGVRFVFPAISLEGRSFWLLRTAPLSLDKLLYAKLLTAIVPLTAFCLVLATLTNWVIGSSPLLAVVSALSLLAIGLAVLGLGTGLGAAFPRFNVENPARIASGFGGLLYMVLAMTLVVAIIALEAYPVWLLHHRVVDGHALTGRELAAAIGLGVAAIGLCVTAVWLPIRIGAKRLDRLGG